MPRLQVVFGSGAGVDGIVADPAYPLHIPLVRMSIPEATERMGEYCCWAALSLLKDARRMAIAQAARPLGGFRAALPRQPAHHRHHGPRQHGRSGRRPCSRASASPSSAGRAAASRCPASRAIAGEAELRRLPGADRYPDLPAAGDAGHARTSSMPRRWRSCRAAPATSAPGAACSRSWTTSWRRSTTASSAAPCSTSSSPSRWRRATRSGRIRAAPSPPHVASLPSRMERAAAVAAAIAGYERGEPLPNLFDHAKGY